MVVSVMMHKTISQHFFILLKENTNVLVKYNNHDGTLTTKQTQCVGICIIQIVYLGLAPLS